MPVRCGLAAKVHPDVPNHDSVTQVALCSQRYYAAKAASTDAEWPQDPISPRLTKALLATIPVHDDQNTGHYAVRNGEAVELYQVERPTEGDAAGSTFVRPYGERTNLKGTERYRVFTAILADPLGAAALFGQTTGKCGICHHGLRVKESLERVVVVDGREITAVGPKCAKKFRRAA